MKTTKDLEFKTRGDFRRLTESAQQQSDERMEAMNPDRLLPLWTVMAESYGNAFVNQFGEEPNSTWIAGLSQFTDDQIKQGFTRAMESESAFAPTLPAFISLCGPEDWESKRLHKPYDPHAEICDRGAGRLLDAPKDERSVDEIRAEIRKNLGL